MADFAGSYDEMADSILKQALDVFYIYPTEIYRISRKYADRISIAYHPAIPVIDSQYIADGHSAISLSSSFRNDIESALYSIWPLRWRHNDHAGVSNHQPPGCLLNRLFRRKSKKTSKLRVTGLCAGNSPGTGEFSAQMASYAENVSIWWRHHAGVRRIAHLFVSDETSVQLLNAILLVHEVQQLYQGYHAEQNISLEA